MKSGPSVIAVRPCRPTLVMLAQEPVDLGAFRVGQRMDVASLDREVRHGEVLVIEVGRQRARGRSERLVIGERGEQHSSVQPPLPLGLLDCFLDRITDIEQPVGIDALPAQSAHSHHLPLSSIQKLTMSTFRHSPSIRLWTRFLASSLVASLLDVQ